MKLRTLLPSIIFLLCGLTVRGQVSQMYYQGFEAGEAVNYSVTPGANLGYSTTIYMSGARALSLNQSDAEDVTIILDTMDFTQDQFLRYISLEFDHICAVRENSSSDVNIGRIYYKRPSQTDNQWTQLTSQHYDMTDGGSREFNMTAAFSRNSYDDWISGTANNEMWRSERFNLDNAIPPSLPTSERKLIIKFVLRRKTHNNALGSWLIDNIKVNSSRSQMIRPSIKMDSYPDGELHPSSRGAHIALTASTTVVEGINPDSVYLFYRVGSNPAPIRVSMQPVAGTPGRFAADIPFEGYDTMMYFYCVARDATSNANQVTFPLAANSWVEYKCVRGVAQPGILTEGFTGTSNYAYVPFPDRADSRSEWVYDSALLAEAGYGPGAMTSFRFTLGANVNSEITRSRFQFSMRNVPTTYTVTEENGEYYFSNSYMKVVYDSELTINAATLNTSQTIQFQDTFYYAGKGIVMQAHYDDNQDRSAATIKMIAAPNNIKTIWYNGGTADMGYQFGDIVKTNVTHNARPAFVFNQEANLPLLYDMGVSELVSPSYDVAMTQRPASITVKLKNFGALPVNAIRISYSIDEGEVTGSYDWTGALNAEGTQNVVIANNINLPAGYHTLRVWVEDTLRAGSNYYRDHEPYNDTSFSQFIVCDGPMNGVRTVGGTGSDFGDMEEFLYAVSRCGIDDSLVVKIAAGRYPAFSLPAIDGSESNYIAFQPMSGEVLIYDAVPGTSSLVNLERVSNVRFRNIKFVRYTEPLSNLVALGLTSHNCQFTNCSFIDSMATTTADTRISSLLSSGFSNGLLVEGCTFIGGRIGVDLKGQAPDILSSGGVVRKNLFRNQYENAVSVQNQTGAVVEGNEMYDVMSNSSYVLMVYESYGATRIMANKVYTSHGAGGVGLSNVTGSAATPALVANNMIVCADDGSANLMTTPFNIIQATYTDVLYNSVKMTALTRSNIAATAFGGGTIANSRFLNNIVVCLDNNNYAFNYMPGNATTNTVGHNVYFSTSGTMCRRAGQAYSSIDTWVADFPADNMSISTNPNFLNGSLVDLRTYNRLIKGVGMPIASVPTDMFDTLRNTTASCPGAFEFVSLGYDFEPEALISPELATCYMPSSVELAVRVRNSGTSSYSGTGLSMAYKVNNGPVQTIAISQAVPADDTVTIYTGQMLSLPANGTRDSLYAIKVWTIYANDPNQTNDTNTFMVFSKYHPATPADITINVPYATVATVTPTTGVDAWPVYGSTAAPQRKSQIYWYTDTTDTNPFFIGNTLVTDTMRVGAEYYFRQRRAQPIVRITQLEFAHTSNVQGLTPNMPYWMHSNRKVALQLTNIGDATAYLNGDTLKTVSPTSTLNDKAFVFGNVQIEPGQSLVVQFVVGNAANPTATVHTGTPLSGLNVAWNSNMAILYKKAGVVEDAVVMNTVPNISSYGVPSYVWAGAGVSIANNSMCGMVRNTFNGNAYDWSVATNASPMFLNTINPSWIFYEDNGCDGYFAKAELVLTNAPDNDLDVMTPVLPSAQCAMGEEDIVVTVKNHGILPVESFVLNYCAGGDTVSETVSSGIPANGSVTHTFAQKLDMAFDRDSTVAVKVWADALPLDLFRANDTNMAVTKSFFTPAAPSAMVNRTVEYAGRDTVSLASDANAVPVWYDYEMNAVDTGSTHVTDILYTGGTRGVAYMVKVTRDGHIGNGTTPSSDSDPNPYNIKNKYVRQQYIYSANELRSAGLAEGGIEAVSFYLSSATTSPSFKNYVIGVGAIEDTVFSSASDWKTTQTVFRRNRMTIDADRAGSWIRHAFDQPFEWDGERSLVFEIGYEVENTANNALKTLYGSHPNTTLFKSQSGEIVPTDAGTKGNKRPNLMFDTVSYGCVGPITTYDVQMINIPPVDMAVYWPNQVDTIVYNSCDSIPIYINVRNQGSADQTGVKLYYYLDDNPVDSTLLSGTILSEELRSELLLKEPIGPGRHTLKAVVSVAGDQTTSNDTIKRSFVVHFCRGTYTIAPNDGDFNSFSAAVDTLSVAGIEGPVVFQVADGTYEEQVLMRPVAGSSDTNTISFVGTGEGVTLTAATTQAANYVLMLDSVSNIALSQFKIYSNPAGNGTYANALVIKEGGNIVLDSMMVKVKGSISNANASCVVLNGDVEEFTMTKCILDSGYYSLKSNNAGYRNIRIVGNTFREFKSQGISLRNMNNLEITNNNVISGNSINNQIISGMYIAQSEGALQIQKNRVYLIDNITSGKKGIQLMQVGSTAAQQAYVVNNMIGTGATVPSSANSTKESAGILVDSNSANINVYYNTVRVDNGARLAANPSSYSGKSYSFFSGASVSSIQLMNNILSNYGYGYASYVSEQNTVTTSNFNAYYTQSPQPYYWRANKATLSALQTTSGGDGNSVENEPYFVADNDLHLLMTNFVSLAQYNSDVNEDIDGRIRPQIPSPTIGAHEMEIKTHDMAVVRVVDPSMPVNIDAFNASNMPPNIESDPVRVIAMFYNNGRSTESNVQWYAYIEGHEATTRTANKSLGLFQPAELKRDTLFMPTVLGITDTSRVHVVVEIPVDSAMDNNNVATNFYLAPAYNFAAVSVASGATGCYLENTPINISVRNTGFKTLVAGTQLEIGYHAEVAVPSDLTIPTLPDTVRETATLAQDLYIGNSVSLPFATLANLYPTGTPTDIKVRITGWASYEHDVTSKNDTIQSSQIDSYFTPDAPIGYDTTLAYGTWGAVRASQVNSRPIQWYRSTTGAAFYSPSQYAASCLWDNTPQYFHDSTYYLRCYSQKGCASDFSSVTVSVRALVPNDIAFDSLLAPLGSRVYMENDTVRVRIKNYGSSSQSNIPITYQLKRNNVVLQEVTEICEVTLGSMQTYVHTFEELLDLPNPTQDNRYTLLVWTDLPTDAIRRNDTIRNPYAFQSIPESAYAPQGSSRPTFDITRVSFNEIDMDIPPLGRGLTDLASYSAPDYPVLHVMRGTSDSLVVEVEQLDGNSEAGRVKIWAMIDFDRSGTFTADEVVVNGEEFYQNEVFSQLVSIPTSASYGYMRMRIAVGLNADMASLSSFPASGIPTDKDGHTMDFLLHVDEQPATADLAISQIVSPRSYLIRDDQPKVVSFRIVNKGTLALNGLSFEYSFEGDTVDPTATGTVSYPGTLQPGTSAVVSLPQHTFPLGTSNLTIWHSANGDENASNDTLRKEYHRFHTVSLVLSDNFDGESMWYAPVGYNAYSRNYWEMGEPIGVRIASANSEPNAWVTDLDGAIGTGKRGNVSYLYSPIFDITQIKPDTLSFYLRRNLTNGSMLYMEYYNYANRWVKVTVADATNWYNNEDDQVFDASTAGTDVYIRHWLATKAISGDFQERLQFRFVYKTPIAGSSSATFGEGAAIDDFRLGRAQIASDVGVIDVVRPEIVQYGRTYYPEVVVQNYGFDTVRTVRIGYTHYSSYLPKQSELACHIAPGGTDTLRFTDPFVVTSDYPDEFTLTAFTWNNALGDIYLDNDTTVKHYSIAPLGDDISAHSFIYPLDKVIAGDTAVRVTMRIRNFGENPITTATATYMVNGQNRVDEDINFLDYLGRPLRSMEYFNYTFRQNLRAPMGVMKITGIIKSEQNEYVFNDTIVKRVTGASAVNDLAAAAVLVDTSDFNFVRIHLVVENRGTRGANGFEVGFILDDDTLQTYRETYYRSTPLAKLSRGYHLFSVDLPDRAAGYPNVKGFVHMDGDQDPSNDSTTYQEPFFTDLEVVKVLVEENAGDSCRLRLQLINRGNLTLQNVRLQAKVEVNGTSRSKDATYRINAGDTMHVEFNGRVAKSPTRTYMGTGRLAAYRDADNTNNETSLVEVVNYFDGVPVVDAAALTLDQNFPNPFTQQTSIPFTLPVAAKVNFFIMDAMGHIVNRFERNYEAGSHTLAIDMSGYASGVYFYGIEVNGERRMRKMIMR